MREFLINEKTSGEITVKKGTHLFHFITEGKNLDLTVNCHRDATYTQLIVQLQSSDQTVNQQVNILEENATANLYALYLTHPGKKNSYVSHLNHKASYTNSTQICKTITDKEGEFSFNGVVFIKDQIKEVNAQQLNKNILMDQSSKVTSRPELLIDSDDVKCAHGATTGMISKEELFYLQLRGFDKQTATSMLIKAHLQEVIELAFKEIPEHSSREEFSENIRKEIAQWMQNK